MKLVGVPGLPGCAWPEECGEDAGDAEDCCAAACC